MSDGQKRVFDSDGKAIQPVIICDKNGDLIKFDDLTSALNVIDYAHHEVHSGSSYTVNINDNDLDNGDKLIIAFKTPNTLKHFHMVAIMKNTSSSLAEILEAPTITNGSGVEISCINRNRNSANTSGSLSIEASPIANKVSTNPTITGDGTVISAEYIGLGKDKGTSETRDTGEIILKQNTIYAFRITGEADNGNATIKLVWYEHTTPS